MIAVTLTINKAAVYEEVAKTTAFTGGRLSSLPDADTRLFDRVFTTDEDQKMLERFWDEAASGATEQLKPWLERDDSTSTDYVALLSVSSSYDTALNNSVQKSLFSYFVAMILYKWFRIANKQDAEIYGNDAVGAMDDVMKKIYHKKKPTRVAPNTQQ